MSGESEYWHQCEVVEWARQNRDKWPELHWLHCSLNGVKLTPGQAVKALKSGMKKGVFDLFLPVKRKKWSGLYIEMKAEKGKVSTSQFKFMSFVESQGYRADVCYGKDHAIKVLEDYLS